MDGKIVIKDYHVYKTLGKGAFASVYQAKCMRNHVDYAMKIIKKKEMIQKGLYSRIIKEIEIHSQLDHPCILKLYEHFHDDDRVYLILELCASDLQTYMQKSKKVFPEDEARRILRQVVEGLCYLKKSKVIHRDIKLSNILLTDKFDIKIADFGLAAYSNENHKTMCGTPNFIAPEVATHSSHGFPVDVWGLGCMFYTLLIGHPPFEEEHTRGTLTQIVTKDIKPCIPARLSKEAALLIEELLEKNEQKRMIIERVQLHPFMTKYNSKSNLLKSMDSGIGSISSSTFSGGSFGRRSRSEVDVRVPKNYDHYVSQKPAASSWTCNNNEPNSLRHKLMAQPPPFGRSPPVRLESLDRGRSNAMKTLRSQFNALPSPSLGFDPDFIETSADMRSGSFSGQDVVDERNRDLYSTRQRYPSRNLPDADLCNRGTNCYRTDYNGCSPRSRHDERQTISHHCSPEGSYECAMDKKPCCSQCTETYSCERDHCPQRRPRCHSLCKESSQCRSVSPSRCGHSGRCETSFCSHNQKASSCSHYGSCDLSHCKHNDVCSCRRSPVIVNSCDAADRHNGHPKEYSIPERSHRTVQSPSVPLPVRKKTLKDQTAPLSTKRLMPIRQGSNNAVASILSTGEVTIELLEKKKDKIKVLHVCRISGDGLRVITYRPDNSGKYDTNAPPPIPRKGAEGIFGYESLPEKYWKKYVYASRFVNLIRAKTPKVTFYNSISKCVLMESNVNFEVTFHAGGKISKSSEKTKIVDADGKSYEIGKDEDVVNLNESLTSMWQSFVMSEKHCRIVAETLESLEEESGQTLFPASLGRHSSSASTRSSASTKKMENTTSSTASINVPRSVSNMSSYDGTMVSNYSNGGSDIKLRSNLTLQKENVRPLMALPSNTQPPKVPSKPKVQKYVFIDGIGGASQLSDGSIRLECNDGTFLTVSVASINFIDEHGSSKNYELKQPAQLPRRIQQKLELLQIAIKKLEASHR